MPIVFILPRMHFVFCFQAVIHLFKTKCKQCLIGFIYEENKIQIVETFFYAPFQVLRMRLNSVFTSDVKQMSRRLNIVQYPSKKDKQIGGLPQLFRFFFCFEITLMEIIHAFAEYFSHNKVNCVFYFTRDRMHLSLWRCFSNELNQQNHCSLQVDKYKKREIGAIFMANIKRNSIKCN